MISSKPHALSNRILIKCFSFILLVSVYFITTEQVYTFNASIAQVPSDTQVEQVSRTVNVADLKSLEDLRSDEETKHLTPHPNNGPQEKQETFTELLIITLVVAGGLILALFGVWLRVKGHYLGQNRRK